MTRGVGKRLTKSLTLIFALALGLASPGRAAEVTVFAAASTAGALEELAESYQAAGGEEVRLVIAASSTLAKQIARGAPADLFLSASPAWMDYLDQRDALDPARRIDLLGNRLVLIVPRDGMTGEELEELSGERLAELLPKNARPLALADPGHVPAGLYAKAALESLGLWPALAGRAVHSAHVRAALALVDRGEAGAGIVYASDAGLSQRVRIAGRFPVGSHPPIVYPLAAVGPEATEAARRFYDHLQSAEAAAVFRAHGFLVPPESGS